MTKLKLSVVKSEGGSFDDVTEHGVLKSLLAKTDSISFSNKNLEGDARVVLFIKENDEDAPKMLSLSARLSKLIRKAIAQGIKKMQLLRTLVELRVIENTDGNFFLIQTGKPAEGATLAELLKQEVMTLEDIIA
jgi:hypothetical protein